MASDGQSKEELFRDGLGDVVGIAEKFIALCPTTAELVAVLRLGLENDAQLNFLMRTVELVRSVDVKRRS